MPYDVVGCMLDVVAGRIKLIADDTDVAGFRDEDAIIDAVQRRSAGSPYAVGSRAAVSDTAARRRIAPDVVGHQNIAGGLPADLRIDRHHARNSQT